MPKLKQPRKRAVRRPSSSSQPDVISLAEMHRRYPDQYLLVADPDLDRQLNVKSGRVVAHSTDRDERDRKAIELQLKSSAFIFTGTVPSDMEFVL